MDEVRGIPDLYLDTVAARIAELCGMTMGTAQDRDLLRLYALLAVSKGIATDLQDVHNAWAIWRYQTKPDHPSIIPFEGLDGDVQAMDAPYAAAIRKVAREMNRAEPLPIMKLSY